MKTVGFLLLVVGWAPMAPIASALPRGQDRRDVMSHKSKTLKLTSLPLAAAGHIQDLRAARRLSISSARCVSSPPPLSDVITGMEPAALVVAAAAVAAAPDDSSWAVFSASVAPTVNINTQTVVLVVNLKNTINMKKSDNESDVLSDDAFDWPGWGHASENPKLPAILIGPPGPVTSFLVDKISANIDKEGGVVLRNAYVRFFNEAGGSPIFLMQLCKIFRHTEVQIVGDEHGDAVALKMQLCENAHHTETQIVGHEHGNSVALNILAQVRTAGVSSIPWSGFCGGPDDGPPQPAELTAKGGTSDEILEKPACRSVEEAVEAAKHIGCEGGIIVKHIGCEGGIIVKASEGGGVDNEEDLRNAYVRFFNEAGGLPIFLMQLCKIFRHAEVQTDEHGDAVTLTFARNGFGEASDDASSSGTSNMSYTISLQWEIIALVALGLLGGLFVMSRGILKGASVPRGRPEGLFGALSTTFPKKKRRKRMLQLSRLRMMIFLALLVGTSFQVDADSVGRDEGSTVHDHSSNMRGSAAPDLSIVSSSTASTPDLKENSDALALLRSSDAALLIKELDESRLALDRGLNDLHLLVGGDYEMLLSTAQDVGIEGFGVESMREVINSFPDLVETVDFMSTMLQQEILPIVADTRDKLTEKLPESGRHLAGLFEYHSRSDDETSQQDTTRTTSNFHADKSSSSSPSDREGFASAFGKEEKRKFMDEMMSREFPGMGGMLNNIGGGINFPGHRSHRSHIRRNGGGGGGQSVRRNRNRDARRLQQQDQTSDVDCSIDKCGLGYIEIVNATQRKRCNCKDLFECVSQLSYTDYAVIFSLGLVDEATGVIDVPEADDEVSELSALNDIYDAKNLLEKINRIRGFVMPGQQDCDSLLNEFHVPCTDWQFGCSESDGKSYRMNIDEICDSVHASERITFASVSTAFDEETTIEDSCTFDEGISIFPTNDELYGVARQAMFTALSIDTGAYAGSNLNTAFIFDEHYFVIGPYAHPDLQEPVRDAVVDVSSFLDDGARAFYGASGWYNNGAGEGVQKLANGLSNSFIIRCLNSDDDDQLLGQIADECNPFLGLGPDPKSKGTQPKSWAKSDNFACVKDRGAACKQALPEPKRQDIDIYVVYYFFAEEEPGGTSTPNWCIGIYVRIDWESTETLYAPRHLKGVCRSINDEQVVRYQSAMRDEIVKAVDSVAPKIEACFARECGLDTKVGLKSCQNMIDCADKIWEAGEIQSTENSAVAISPNPYYFTSSDSQDATSISSVKNLNWNTNLALGRTIVASSSSVDTTEVSSEDVLSFGPYSAVDGKVDTYWKSDANSESNEQWVVVDLGQQYELQKIEIDWERRPNQYDISVGNDNINWNYTLSSLSLAQNDSSIVTKDAINGKFGQYVRINATVATNFIGIREIAISADASAQSAGTSKWNTINWPTSWRLQQDPQHGTVTFPDPTPGGALDHIGDLSSSIDDTVVFETTLSAGDDDFYFEHTVNLLRPKLCGLDTREDDRCDVARAVLFGKSTSVGQICSIAEAVTTNPETGEYERRPENMPGSCCLDNVDTLESFGKRFTCGNTCQKPAPYTLGISEEACLQVGGVWCRRPCTKLKQCIEDKPSRDKCRIAARYSIGLDAFNLTHSGNECDNPIDESIHLIISCTDEDGEECKLPSPQTLEPSTMPSTMPSAAPSSVPSETNSNSTSRRILNDAFNTSEHNTSTLENITGSDPISNSYNVPSGSNTSTLPAQPSDSPTTKTRVCEEKIFTFSYRLSFDFNISDLNASGTDGAIVFPETQEKLFIHFVEARNGKQTDLYSHLGNATEVTFGSSPLIINVTETIKLCSDDEEYESLVVLEFQNSDFNAAFDIYSEDLNITDASDEEQCQTARELLGFDADYIDDFEICREFDDVKCDYEKKRDESNSRGDFVLATPTPVGGAIPDFQGFTFQPISFNGFNFDKVDDFVGFDFRGFKPSKDLAFKEVQQFELATSSFHPRPDIAFQAFRNGNRVLDDLSKINKKTLEGAKASECPFVIVWLGGAGTDAPCVFFNTIKMTIIGVLVQYSWLISILNIVAKITYSNLFGFKDEDAWKNYYWSETTYNNVKDLNTALYGNLNIMNTNMATQHTAVRSTLEAQHSRMMDILSDQHTEIGEQLTNQHNQIGDQLTEQHSSIGEQLTAQHNSVGEQLTTQHNSIGNQLTEQHRILRENVIALAETFGGSLGNDPDDRRLNDVTGDDIVDFGNISLIQLINDTHAAVSALETDLEALKAHATETNATLGNGIGEVQAEINATKVELQNGIGAVQAEINTTNVNLQNGIGEVQAEINATNVNLQTEIDALDTKIESVIASLQTSATGSAVGGDEGATTGRRTRQLQSAAKDDSIGLVIGSSLGLTVDVQCPPPMNGSGKSTKGQQTVTIDLLIISQTYGKDCEANVTNATTYYVNKKGDYKRQVGDIESSTPMDPGVQIVRILFEKKKGEIFDKEDVTLLRINAIKKGGTAHEKSVTFDYSECRA